MTRLEFHALCRANLLIEMDSPLRDFGGDAEERMLDRAADQCAQDTDCYFDEQIDTLTAGKTVYCAPKIYKPKAYYVLDSGGNRVALDRFNTAGMTRQDKNWRTRTAVDPPSFVVTDGLTEFQIGPAPSVTRAGGLIVAGFALSTLPKVGRERHQWVTDTDECPLPAMAHDAVLALYTARRARQLAVRLPNMLTIAAAYEAEYRTLRGHVCAEATRIYQAQKGNPNYG